MHYISQGDSGSSLNCPDGNGGYYLAGVTSWGILNNISGIIVCDVTEPSVYTRTSSYLEWIEEKQSVCE